MVDVHDKQTRSRNMAAVRSKDTQPELIIRRILHRSGFRFRLHRKDIAGKPDIVLPKLRVVIFVNGCFWHGHDCHLFKLPATRAAFWLEKISGNRIRDEANLASLHVAGWRTCTVWECAVLGKLRLTSLSLQTELTEWLSSEDHSKSIVGNAK